MPIVRYGEGYVMMWGYIYSIQILLQEARGRALDAAQKQNFFDLFACISNYVRSQQRKMASQNMSSENVMANDTCYNIWVVGIQCKRTVFN